MNDCSNHKKDILGIDDMELLAEKIGDLNYEVLTTLLGHLAEKISRDGRIDHKNGRVQLGSALKISGEYIFRAQKFMEKAWIISKPYMINTKI